MTLDADPHHVVPRRALVIEPTANLQRQRITDTHLLQQMARAKTQYVHDNQTDCPENDSDGYSSCDSSGVSDSDDGYDEELIDSECQSDGTDDDKWCCYLSGVRTHQTFLRIGVEVVTILATGWARVCVGRVVLLL